MRIRNYRQGDIPTLVHIQQVSAQADGAEMMNTADFEAWLEQPELVAPMNVFKITDDAEDDPDEWGQAGTLDGLEGETIGYTVLQLRRSQHAYHFLCEGAVLPQHRRRGAGQALLICTLNHVRIRASEFEFEAQQEGVRIYFEALLPVSDSASEKLAAKFDMQPTDEHTLRGMRLYRTEL
ncbi:MAG TPA: GNAT family N-acetyltransferase [Ktedonobacteraceae bacterium]|nr:GNAT family N-acetyltransferase [Ktedonobacteraceae bacterium]